MNWENYKTILIGNFTINNENINNKKLACFDLDGTLIKTLSGQKFMKDYNDWQFKYDNVKSKLNYYCKNNFKIIIFTNQGGMKKIGLGENGWKKFFENFAKNLQLNISVYVALEYDYFRKPFIGMWDTFKERNKISPDYFKESFYSGDACGRICDFSDSDLKFALNCNLNFIIPENLFARYEENNNVCLNELYYVKFEKYIDVKNDKIIPKYDNEIIIFVGNYASGKTSYYRKNLQEYILLDNFDKLNSNKKQNRFVIDNTNLSKAERMELIKNIKKYDTKYILRCMIFICPIGLSMHNSKYSYYISKGNKKMYFDEILCQFKEKFEYPELDEGFSEIIRYKFCINSNVNLNYFNYYF